MKNICAITYPAIYSIQSRSRRVDYEVVGKLGRSVIRLSGSLVADRVDG